MVTSAKDNFARPVSTWCSMTRQIRVSCSRVIPATLATGIAAAKVTGNASNSNVKPDSGRAHDSPT